MIGRPPDQAARTREAVERIARRLPQPWTQWALFVTEDESGSHARAGTRADVFELFRGAADLAGRPDVVRPFIERITTRPGSDLAVIVFCPTGWFLDWASAEVVVNSRGGLA